MVIIYVDKDEGRHSSWTELHWQFGSIREHKLRQMSEFIRSHAEIDIGPSSWDCVCDNDWLDSSLMGEIYTHAWSSDHVDDSKSTRLLWFRIVLVESVR